MADLLLLTMWSHPLSNPLSVQLPPSLKDRRGSWGVDWSPLGPRPLPRRCGASDGVRSMGQSDASGDFEGPPLSLCRTALRLVLETLLEPSQNEGLHLLPAA